MCSIHRSTARLTSGQRTALNDVEEAHTEDREDGRYFVYEHLAQVRVVVCVCVCVCVCAGVWMWVWVWVLVRV